MFTINNTEFRNLQEQVLQNKQDIARHYNVDRVLADFGITVLGRVTDAALLPQSTENFGDAYLVGQSAPYMVYVWTRANPNAGHDSPYWLDIGSISIIGPEGPAGRSITNAGLTSDYQLRLTFSDGTIMTVPGGSLKGPKGDNGINGKTPRIEAVQTNTGANITTYDGDGNLTGNVQISNGAPGQSIVGPQGPAGTFNIKGILTSADLLPSASSAAPGDAYLITSTTSQTHAYDLWVIVNADSDAAEWTNTGALSAGTVVTVGGVPQTTFDADTKVSKLTDTSGLTRALSQKSDGTIIGMPLSESSAAYNTIPIRTTRGAIVTGEPVQANHATPRSYVDNIANYFQTAIDAKVPKLTDTTSYIRALTQKPDGTISGYQVLATSALQSTIPLRSTNGAIVTGTPTDPTHAATKAYVDTAIANAGGSGGSGLTLTHYSLTASDFTWEIDESLGTGIYKLNISSYIPSDAKLVFLSKASNDGYCSSSRVWPLGYQVGQSAFTEGTLALDYNGILYVKDVYNQYVTQPTGYINIDFI